MLKRKFLMISLFLFFGLILSSLSGVHASSTQSKRLWGKDRYETCSAVVKEGWSKCEYAVLVSGENFPDALSASVLAKKYNAPILLTQAKDLNKETVDQFVRLGVKKVFIVGGEMVVNMQVENAIKNMGIKTERFKGQDRNGTSIRLAREIGIENGMILAAENDYTDALSIAPIAAKLQIPIVLIPKDGVPHEVKEFIDNKKIPVTYILGGEDCISKTVECSFQNTKRISGANKYEKNINIIKEFSDKINFNSIYVAYSEEFPDALSVSAMAALTSSPTILVGDEVEKVTSDFIKEKMEKIFRVSVVGGVSGIDEEILTDLINGNLSKDKRKINVNGNTSGNLSNYGYYAVQEKWAYYSNFDDGGKLYKMKLDGSHNRKLSDDKSQFINVVGDWIYYIKAEDKKTSIEKIKIDGSSKVTLVKNENQIRFLNVNKDKVFYFTWGKENNKNICYLNEITVDGIEIGKVFSFEEGFTPWYLNICGDYAYCLIDIHGSSGVYKLDLNKKLINKVVEDALCINVYDNWIYYGTHNGIYKIKVDGSDNKKITDNYPGPLPNGQWGDPACFNIDGKWIYYKDFNEQSIYKIDIDGNNKSKLKNCMADSISILGDYLYSHEYKYDGINEIYNYVDTVKIKK